MDAKNDPHGKSRMRDLAPKPETENVLYNWKMFLTFDEPVPELPDAAFSLISKTGIVIEPNSGNGCDYLIWDLTSKNRILK